MRLTQLRQFLSELRDMGFVSSERMGPTGIGHTLEKWLNISENNLPIPDIGGRTEIKATRNTTNNLITLFTFNRAAWKVHQAEVVKRWGYFDAVRNRQALYSTVSALAANPQGLQAYLPDDSEMVCVIDSKTNEVVASWDLFNIVGKFMSKFERLLLVHADVRQREGREEFHFNQAHLLTEPNSKQCRDSFMKGKALIDIRMHLKPSGASRNHGTGFRVYEKDLPNLFGSRIDLMSP